MGRVRHPVRGMKIGFLRYFCLAGLLGGCVQYRTYPLMSLDLPDAGRPLEPSGIALLDDGTMVAVAEGDARALLVPAPDRPLHPGDPIGVFPLHDARDDCPRE